MTSCVVPGIRDDRARGSNTSIYELPNVWQSVVLVNEPCDSFVYSSRKLQALFPYSVVRKLTTRKKRMCIDWCLVVFTLMVFLTLLLRQRLGLPLMGIFCKCDSFHV